MEHFDPHNSEYKKVEDLPTEEQSKYVNLPDRGFVRKEAVEELRKNEVQAQVENSERPLYQRILKINKVNSFDILEDDARQMNDQIEREGTHDFEGYEKKEFPVWKSIKIGTGEKTGDDFAAKLNDEGFLISTFAVKDILGNLECADSSQELNLVRVTLADLGFKKTPSLRSIKARAEELGLKPCPAEVGPQLRLQYKDQPKDDWLYVGMEPMLDSKGFPIIFAVVEEDGLFLHSNYNSDIQVYNLEREFVFTK